MNNSISTVSNIFFWILWEHMGLVGVLDFIGGNDDFSAVTKRMRKDESAEAKEKSMCKGLQARR